MLTNPIHQPGFEWDPWAASAAIFLVLAAPPALDLGWEACLLPGEPYPC